MCCDTIAVTDEVGVLSNYICEVRKRLGKQKKSGKGDVNITAAIQSDLSSSLKAGADPDRCNRSICYGQIFQR